MRRQVTALCLMCFTIAVLTAPNAWAQAPIITVTQGDFTLDVRPITGELNAAALYDYRNERANLGFGDPGRSIMFFYQDPDEVLSLIVVHGPPALDVTNSTGIVRFIFSDLPESTTFVVRDDPEDQYEVVLPAARLRWKWHTGRTDGAVLSHLGEDFGLSIFPHFIQGVTQWDVLSQGPDGPESHTLPHMDQTVQMSSGAAAGRGTRSDFSFFPSQPYTFVPVTFDASASLAPQGDQITLYEWDFDGDGTFDAHTERATVSNLYQFSGTTAVTLRVSTLGGGSATKTKPITLTTVERLDTMREISTPSALPESTFRVTLTFQADQDLAGLGVEENWPPGWTIQPVQNDGAILKAELGQWVFPDIVRAGETRIIEYDVTLPDAFELDGLPDAFNVEGTITSSLPPFKAVIEGEDTVLVASCLALPVALAHYDMAFGELDLRLDESITTNQVAYAETLWLHGGTLPGACAESVSLADYQRILSYRSLSLNVDQALPDGGVGRGIRAERALLTSLPGHQLYLKAEGGNRLRVRLTIDVLRTIASLGIEERLPQGWQMLPIEVPNSMYNKRTNDWLIAGPFESGQQVVLYYDVVVPLDETPYVYLLRGSAHLADSAFTEVITGHNILTVVECLSVLVAIAHWNVAENSIDLTLDNIIQPSQAIAATDLWLYEIEVPGTCGEKIDFETLQLITNYALAGVPVSEDLP